MQKIRHANGFTAIKVTGSLLPPEFLQTVAAQEAQRQANADYGITKSLNLKDELGRYWRIAHDLWTAYDEKRVRHDLDLSRVTVADWLIPLLADVLGYRDIARARSVSRGGRGFPLTHRAHGGSVALVLTTHEHDLDRLHPLFGDEARRRSPHGLLQEYLNAADDCLWGIVANGTKLRLVRDNPSLSRQAYIEVDLELMFSEQLYADFTAFWLLMHGSRLEPRDGKPAQCTMELWRQAAHETGQRALERLRDGVTEALRHLGNGFLQHPGNEALRAALANGDLTADTYFQELLRLVYRFIFLFKTEERQLLHTPQATPDQRAIYAEGYSLARIRDRAGRRRHYDQHTDLWQSLQVVFRGLQTGAEPLGLPALGGLFAAHQCPTLDQAQLPNERLLLAIRALAYTRTADSLARVNYRDMDTEELGSVYESLLELQPYVDVDGAPWEFKFLSDLKSDNGRGTERKLSGSYYTPASLVDELIKSALKPVLADALRKNPENPRQAILELRVIDPAAGSGHFLLAAARRLAQELARIDTASDTPDEAAHQRAMREVIQHCIYGVDRNPLAVELCRTALWLEALEPGKPLNFLDANIQCGDSLIGVHDPSVLHQGIPEAAYTPLTGDDRAVCKELKRLNRNPGYQYHLAENVAEETAATTYTVNLTAMPEQTIADVQAKEEAWRRRQESPERQRQQLLADLYVGAYFMPKTVENKLQVPLSVDLHLMMSQGKPRPHVAAAVQNLAAKHRFFHWHLAFPDIMSRGGFDVVLGNPPWERIKLQEQEFFSGRSAAIAEAPNKAARDRLIKKLADPDATPAEQALYRAFQEAKREAEASSLYVRTSGRFPLTGVGDVNTYAVFAETFLDLTAPGGRAGLIVPSGIATDKSTKAFFDEVIREKRLVSLCDFENREGLFSGVHRSYKFCLLTLGWNATAPEFVFFATKTEHLREKERRFTLTEDDIRLLNPNTRTCPIFRSKADAELTKKIYSRVPVLIDESKGAAGNPWGISFMRMFDMANDARLFKTYREFESEGARLEGTNWIERGASGRVWVPLYEAKMIHQFDHRWATYEPDGKTSRYVTEAEKADANYAPLPRYWVPQDEVEKRLREKGWDKPWLLGWRDITNATNERTVIATLLPRVGVGNKIPLVLVNPRWADIALCLVANFSSLCLDYIARQKVGGTTLNYFYLKQFPILAPMTYTAQAIRFIVPRVAELLNFSGLIGRLSGTSDSASQWDVERRRILRAELDAYYAFLYGLTRDELEYVLDPQSVWGPDHPGQTFRVLKETELKTFGVYRTRDTILAAWDRLVKEGVID